MNIIPLDIINNFLTNDPNIEVEIKYKNISVGTFYRILNQYPKLEPIETLDTTINNIRITTYSNGTVEYIKKDRLYPTGPSLLKEEEWGLRLVISKETQVNTKPVGNPTSIRRKRRWSYNVNNNVRLDMTWVTDEIAKKDSWEIELELISKNSQDLSTLSIDMLKKIQDTNILYKPELKNQIIFDWNTLLVGKYGDSKNPVFDHNILNKPINLRRKDMTHGTIDNYYTITLKINGYEKCLYFHQTGIWLIHPPQEANFLMKHTDKTKEYIGTCLLGEIIYDVGKMIYIPYDTLSWKGDKNIQNYNHLLDRLPKCKELADQNLFISTSGLPLMEVFMKEFIYVGKTPENFAAAYQYMLNLNNRFKIDGYILTPIQEPYSKSKIFKIKNFDELTIDFKIINGQPTTVQREHDETKYITFNGEVCTSFDPNTQLRGDYKNLEGNVVEFKPIKENDEIYLTPLRIRYDKTSPNTTQTALNIWKEIQSPWTSETLLGENFDRLYYQNNVLKAKIFENIGGIIVDIGSGRGGDITKWSLAEKVLAIEPNIDNFNELNHRIKCSNLEGKIKTLNCKGEDTNLIITKLKELISPNGDSQITISMMLSLSFFWKNEYTLNQLQNTLVSISKLSNKPTEFLYFTIDGNRTLKLFQDYGKNIQLGPASMDFLPIRGGISLKGTVDINIKDSIVNEQTEYLVNLNDMKCLQNITESDSIIQEYLTTQEKIFGNLFIYGKSFINKNTILNLEMVDRITFNYIGTEPNTPTQPDKVVDLGVNGSVRISTIKEGGSFFHALLNAISSTYQESNYYGRMQLVKNVRNDLVDYLQQPSNKVVADNRAFFAGTENLPVNAYYFTLDKLAESNYNKYIIPGTNKSNAYNEIVKLLKSDQDIPITDLAFISEVFHINILFVNTKDNIKVDILGQFPSDIPNSKSVILYYYPDNTFETVGRKDAATGLIKTIN